MINYDILVETHPSYVVKVKNNKIIFGKTILGLISCSSNLPPNVQCSILRSLYPIVHCRYKALSLEVE